MIYVSLKAFYFNLYKNYFFKIKYHMSDEIKIKIKPKKLAFHIFKEN